MRSMGTILRSRARTDLLQALHAQPAASGVRYLARIAGIHPHSAELALNALVDEALVKKKSAGARPLYALNWHHPETCLLDAIFNAATTTATRVRNKRLAGRARTILPFIDEARRMVNHAKGTHHVT